MKEDRLAHQGPSGWIKRAYFDWRLGRSLQSIAAQKNKEQQQEDEQRLSDYEQRQQRKKARFRRIIGVISLVSFTGSISFTTIQGLLQGLKSQEQTVAQPTGVAKEYQEKLKAEEQGYLLVLQREPNNLVALDGLAAARIKARNWKGAIEPLEKMVALNPAREDLKTLLQDVKRRAGQN